MKRVALKFCGGCDPTYERVEYWREISSAAEGHIEWVHVDEETHNTVLLICGCDRVCPEKELNQRHRIITLKNADTDPQQVVEMLLEE